MRSLKETISVDGYSRVWNFDLMGALVAACVCIMFSASYSEAQNYEKIPWEIQQGLDGFTFSYPSDWRVIEDARFSAVVWAADDTAYCTIKRTVDSAFSIITAEQFIADRLAQQEDTISMLPLQYHDGSGILLLLKEFPFGLETGLVLVTMGNMNDQPVVNSTFQTIHSGAAFTLACFTSPENQGYYFPVFAQFVERFRFDG